MTPAPTACVDSNNGALNRFGNGCEFYHYEDENPYVGICLDPYYDDEDFSSYMCCECPAECPSEPEILDTCEDWVTFAASNDDGVGRNSHSNLAGLGPDFGKPKELRHYGVGQLMNGHHIDIVFVNTTAYVPRNTNWNQISGS
jgi:hypothetical protein